ncbi:type II secretion system F family protein [Candidatus Woesearchaeota archaeon]|nr:type II secretion system F family protein [Candidatus Woesearchaeota archaeon]
MPHKNAQQLLGEVGELLREFEVYLAQKESLFTELKKLGTDYQAGKYSYAEYEERQKAVLRGRSRAEWVNYYNAYMYSLLKKADFIVSQAFAIVHDDDSFNSLEVVGGAKLPKSVQKSAASAPVSAAAAATDAAAVAVAENSVVRKQEAQRHAGVFRIDNEIERLRQLLASRPVSQQQLEKVERAFGGFEGRLEGIKGKISVNIPKAEELAGEVEQSERKALKARAERSKQLAKQLSKTTSVSQPSKGVFAAAMRSAALVANAAKAALRFVAGVPATAAKSVRNAIRRIRARAPSVPKEKPTGQTMEPTFSKLPSPSALFNRKEQQVGVPTPLQKEGIFSALKQLVNPKSAKKKGIFVEEIVAMEKRAKRSEMLPLEQRKEPAGLAFGWFSVRGLLNEFTEKFRSRQEPILAEKTAIPMHMKKLKEMRKRLYEEEKLSSFDATLLAQEARRVKRILEVEKPEVYHGSSVGLIANLTVRKISLFLVDAFPEFFGFLYNALRAANVKVLSNTYVNIMILSTMFVVGITFAILLPLFLILGYPIYQIVLRTLIFSFIAGFACATVFYAYPFVKIKERRRNIMTNMPFGVNHMAAVATSGVPPSSMFELISASREYGEIGIEVKKIVDFINIFGYDLLTAIRTVAATTPSQQFKEFLDGMVSTIETGGDLDSYLRQEADQAALTYNLERQRYNETVSTYSDIYTGLLIAAPLFFVAAMALVNLLGGTLGGIGVDVVMAFGAYLVIPLLNIGFLVFLQVTQPEV